MNNIFGEGKYTVLGKSLYKHSNLTLRSIQPGDIESIRKWRNEQMVILRQDSIISFDEQIEYYKNNIWPEKNKKRPSQILLSIVSCKELIGYGGLVNISWVDRNAEISFLLSPEHEKDIELRTNILLDFLHIIETIAFKELKFRHLWSETYENRIKHIETLEKYGLKKKTILNNHVIINGIKINSLIHVLTNK